MISLPYAEIKEPFEGWLDLAAKSSRIDYYHGEKNLTCDCFSQTWLCSYFPPWLDQWCETESLMCQTKMRRAEHKHSKKWKRMSKHVTVGSGYTLTWPLMCCVVVSFVSSPPWSCWVSLFQRLILWTTFNVPTCTQWCFFYNVLISSCGHYVCNFIIIHTKQMHALAKQKIFTRGGWSSRNITH